MRIEFNPTGTNIHKGYLKTRWDVIPSPTDKTYQLHYIQVPVIPPEGYQGRVDELGNPTNQRHYDGWLSRLPRIWQLNPCLCHFIAIPENIPAGEMADSVARIFDMSTLATIDNALILPNSAHYISPFMRNKRIPSVPSVKTRDIEDLVASVNQRLGGLALSLSGGGEITPIEPQTIDVGAAATDRNTVMQLYYTTVEQTNPANATGTIDTIEIWMNTNASNAEVASFYVVSENNLSTRDNDAMALSLLVRSRLSL